MTALTDSLLIITVMLNLSLLASGRMTSVIHRVSLQGIVLSIVPLLLPGHEFDIRLLVVSIAAFLMKGFLFPRLLRRSLRDANVRREVEPIIGFTTSFALGVVLLGLSFYIATRLPLPGHLGEFSSLVLPVGLSTILSGLFLIVTRHQALMQVVGYLVLENGIFLFGTALAHEEPLLIEMGVLLDVFVGVFVMGIAMFHISKTFDHIDVQQLSQLRD